MTTTVDSGEADQACVLVAHGTRDPAGAAVVEELADLVRRHLPDVRVAFADVRGPSVTDVLRDCQGPAVVVPAFLAAGYHVKVDIPAQIAAAGTPAVLTPHLGPDLVTVARHRLAEAGWVPGQPVVLAASGSSDPRARREVYAAARRLGAARVGFVATSEPALGDVLAGGEAVASWFLAPGLFHRRAVEAGADVTAAPLGAHPAVAELIIRRYRHATVREQWVSQGGPGLGLPVCYPR
ncbi:MAG: sirohydrochlorin chelatase [Actinophytocola sp.]|uniref:sirohydrochlorin chelatase n=1 Tax=Actinophytocola sp. TaxID=1872138 RepID=UPI003C770F00